MGGPEHQEGFVEGLLAKTAFLENGEKLFPHGSSKP
jgi:hypothetical protein